MNQQMLKKTLSLLCLWRVLFPPSTNRFSAHQHIYSVSYTTPLPHIFWIFALFSLLTGVYCENVTELKFSVKGVSDVMSLLQFLWLLIEVVIGAILLKYKVHS